MTLTLGELEKLIEKCGHNLLMPTVIDLNDKTLMVLVGSTTRTNYYEISKTPGGRVGSVIVRFSEDMMFVQSIFINEEFRHSGIATKAILELCRLSKCKSVIGKMVWEAIPFWIKLSGDDSYNQFRDREPNCLIPFKFDVNREEVIYV